VVSLCGTVLLSSAEHFNEHTKEDQTNGEPLPVGHRVAVDDDGSQHSEEFSGGGHDTEDQRWEVSNGVEDEDLSESTENSQEDQILDDKRVFNDELDESTHLEGWDGDSKADDTGPLVKTFHLVPLVGVELLLNFTLSSSEETIAEQWYEEGKESDDTGAVFTLLFLSISEIEKDDTSGDDETAEVLALAVLTSSAHDEGDNKNWDNLGRFHNSLDWEWDISKGLTCQEHWSETATSNKEFGFNVHLGLLLVVIESVDGGSDDEAEEVLEERCSETEAESFVSSLFSVESRVVISEQSFHDKTEIDVGEIDTSDGNGEFDGSGAKYWKIFHV